MRTTNDIENDNPIDFQYCDPSPLFAKLRGRQRMILSIGFMLESPTFQVFDRCI